MRFPYFQLDKENFAPIIPLKIKGREGWITFEAYIDSGASLSIFSIDRARILGINYTKGEKMRVVVGNGDLLEVHIHRLQVELANSRFHAQIGFSAQLGIGFNLLGRKSFFERFKICFDDKHGFVELHNIGEEI